MKTRRIITLQRRFRELGRIRLGRQVAGESGKRARPAKLDAFRLTSASRDLLEDAARIYGGEVTEWTDTAPVDGLFELFTTSPTLDIVIPPMVDPYSQALELWTGGGCVRRCDGVTAIVAQKNGMRERPCVCADLDDDDTESDRCVPVTRVNVMLPQVADVGVWRLESHGWNAAVELPGTLDLLALAQAHGTFLPGRLRIDHRQKKVPGKPISRFVVPVIDLQHSMGELLAGAELPTLERGPATPTGRPELPAETRDVTSDPVVVESQEPDHGAPPDLPPPDEAPPPAPAPPPEADADVDDDPGPEAPPTGGATAPPAEPAEKADDARPITERQRRFLFGLAKRANVSQDDLRILVAAERGDGESSTKDGFTRAMFERITDHLEDYRKTHAAPTEEAEA